MIWIRINKKIAVFLSLLLVVQGRKFDITRANPSWYSSVGLLYFALVTPTYFRKWNINFMKLLLPSNILVTWNLPCRVPMVTSSNGNIFRATGPLCVEFTVTDDFLSQMPVTQSFDVFIDLRLNKRLCKQSRRRLFETPSRSLWFLSLTFLSLSHRYFWFSSKYAFLRHA